MIDTMLKLATEAYEYVQITWAEEEPIFKNVSITLLKSILQPYGAFYNALIPDGTPDALKPYIHRERILYDLYQNDKVMVFRYDPADDSDNDAESFYSNSELEEDEEKVKHFVNGILLLDDYYFREQLTANEFTGGYWEPDHHWVLSREKLLAALKSN
jgi:hypothetical protein